MSWVHWDGLSFEDLSMSRATKGSVTSYVESPGALLQGIEHFHYGYIWTELCLIQEKEKYRPVFITPLHYESQ